jgi:tRNA 2-thiouridine synthesizing protein A
MTTLPTADHVIDCRGTYCPMPIIRLRQAIDDVEVGAIIQLLATDPASANDMPAFASNTGHELLSATEANGVFEYLFRKVAEES